MKLRSVPVFSAGTRATIDMPVVGMHSLTAGMTGSGKSTTLRCLLAGAAFEPDLAIVGIDPKRGAEFGPWAPRAAAIARTPEESAGLLEALVQVMLDRYDVLAEKGLQEWTPTAEAPAILCAIDELAELLDCGDKVLEDRCAKAIRSLLRMARAVAITLACATQRPSSEAIPTDVRDSFGFRVSHALMSVESTRMIFGAAAELAPAHQLPVGPEHAGQAWVLREGERTPHYVWTLYVAAADVPALAARTAHLAPELRLTPVTAHGPVRGTWAAPKPGAGDVVDRQVLDALADGPVHYTAVAEAVGITADAARKRLARLEADGRVTHEQGSPLWAAS